MVVHGMPTPSRRGPSVATGARCGCDGEGRAGNARRLVRQAKSAALLVRALMPVLAVFWWRRGVPAPWRSTPAPPNSSLNRTRNGMALGPRGTAVYHAPRGPSAMPLRAG